MGVRGMMMVNSCLYWLNMVNDGLMMVANDCTTMVEWLIRVKDDGSYRLRTVDNG